MTDIERCLSIIESALESVDQTEDANGDVWDLPDELAAMKAVRAEIERLRDDYSVLKQDYDALRAANEHQRTMLGYLADNIDDPALVAVAEAALKPKP